MSEVYTKVSSDESMIKSETVTELFKALVSFQAEAPIVKFDAENPFFHNKYASLANIVETCRPVLAKHNLAVTQLTVDDGGVVTILAHNSGEYIGSKLVLKPTKPDPQGVGSAITYARRYSYTSILGIVTDEDDDATQASAQTQKSTKPETAPPVAKSNAPSDSKLISDPQRKRLFAIAMGVGMGKETFKDWLKWGYDYDSSTEITRDDYEEICKAAEEWKA